MNAFSHDFQTRLAQQLPQVVAASPDFQLLGAEPNGPLSRILASALGVGGGGGGSVGDQLLRALPIPVELYKDDELPPAERDIDAFEKAQQASRAPNTITFGRPLFLAPKRGSGPDGAWLISTFGQNGYYADENGDFIPNYNPATMTGGTFVDTSDETGNIVSDITVLGVPGQTIVQKAHDEHPYIFFCNPAGIGTPEEPDEQEYVFKNIKFRGLVTRERTDLGYREFFAHYHMNCVDGLEITDFVIDGARGDGAHQGAGDIGGGGQNRFSRNTVIARGIIDGKNRNNRNGISVIDCDGMLIEDVWISNFSRPGNPLIPADPFDINSGVPAPGGIDAEPNTSFTLNPRIKNLTIRRVRGIGIGSGVLAFLFGTDNDLPSPFVNVTVEDIYAEDCLRGLATFISGHVAKYNFDIRVAGATVVNCGRPFEIIAFAGLSLRDLYARRCPLPGNIGYVAPQLVDGFFGQNWTFDECGEEGGASIEMRGMRNHSISDVTLRNCNANGFTFTGGNKFEKSSIERVRVVNTDDGAFALTNPALVILSDPDGVPDIDTETLRIADWDTGELGAGNLICNGAPVLSPPLTGISKEGTYLPIAKAGARGGPKGFYCYKTNVAGQEPFYDRDVPMPGAPTDRPITQGEMTFPWVSRPTGSSVRMNWGTLGTSTGRFSGDLEGRSWAVQQGKTVNFAGGADYALRFAAPYRGEDGVLLGLTRYADLNTRTVLPGDAVTYGYGFDRVTRNLIAIRDSESFADTGTGWSYGDQLAIIVRDATHGGEASLWMELHRWTGSAWALVPLSMMNMGARADVAANRPVMVFRGGRRTLQLREDSSVAGVLDANVD